MIDLLSEVAGKGTDVVWTDTFWLHHLTAATLRLRLSFAIQLNPISSQPLDPADLAHYTKPKPVW